MVILAPGKESRTDYSITFYETVLVQDRGVTGNHQAIVTGGRNVNLFSLNRNQTQIVPIGEQKSSKTGKNANIDRLSKFFERVFAIKVRNAKVLSEHRLNVKCDREMENA